MLQFIFILFTFFHPFYISVTEVKHNAKAKSLEISTKIFFDDLEKDIENESNTNIDIIKPISKEKADVLIASYLKKHLQVKVNSKLLNLKYLGYQIQEDAAWCYLQVDNINKVSTIEVNNNVLYNLHKEQINMLNVIVNGERKSTKLDNPESRAVFEF
jgi:hypothetical protein